MWRSTSDRRIGFSILFAMLGSDRVLAGPDVPGACCLPDGACATAVEDPPGTFCCGGSCQGQPYAGSCLGVVSCLLNGSCIDVDEYCCIQSGGDPHIGNDCNNNGVHDACELEDADCNSNQVPDDCESPQACCQAEGRCSFVPVDCCASLHGHPAGAGTVCEDVGGFDFVCGASWACCVPQPDSSIPYCMNWTVQYCIDVAGGTPLGAGLVCKQLPDEDEDGVVDPCDNCADGANPAQADCDADGIGDACEADAGEADDDGDGVCNAVDGCPQDPAKLEPGACGCGTADVDSDLDSVPDCQDQCPDANDLVDANFNNIPDCLDGGAIPAASAWGLAILTMCLLIAAKIRYSMNGERYFT